MKKFVLFLIAILLIAVIGVGGVHVYDRYFAKDENPGITDDTGDDNDDDNTDNGNNTDNGGNTDNGAGDDDGATDVPGDNTGSGDNNNDNTDDSGNTGDVEVLDDLYIYRTIDSNGNVEFDMLGRKSFSIYLTNYETSGMIVPPFFSNLVEVGTTSGELDVTYVAGVESAFNTEQTITLSVENTSYFKDNLVLICLTDGDKEPLNPPEDFPGNDGTIEEPEEPDVPVEPETPTVTTSTINATYIDNENFIVDKNVAGDAISCTCCSGVSESVLNVKSFTPAYTDQKSHYEGLEFVRSTDNVKSMTFKLKMTANSSKNYKYFPEVAFIDVTNSAHYTLQFSCWNNSLSLKVLGNSKDLTAVSYNDVISSIDWTSSQTNTDGVTYYTFDAIIKIELIENGLRVYKDGTLFVTIDMTERFERTGFKQLNKIVLGFRADDVNSDENIVEYNIGSWHFHNVILEREEVADKEFVGMVYFDFTTPLTFNMQGYDSFKVKGCDIYTCNEDNNSAFYGLWSNGEMIGTIWRENNNVSITFDKTLFSSYASRVGLIYNNPFFDLPITLMNK